MKDIIENLKSSQIVYSEHHYDECFEYKDGSGRVPDGAAIGYTTGKHCRCDSAEACVELILFDDIQYCECDHDYWDNYELEHDASRVVVG